MVKRFSMGEIKTVAGRLIVTKPLGIMDRRWNQGIEALLLELKRNVDLEEAGYDPESNLRPIKLEEDKHLS